MTAGLVANALRLRGPGNRQRKLNKPFRPRLGRPGKVASGDQPRGRPVAQYAADPPWVGLRRPKPFRPDALFVSYPLASPEWDPAGREAELPFLSPPPTRTRSHPAPPRAGAGG